MRIQHITDTVERRIVRQRAEDLRRLADKAAREGVVVFYEPVEERHYATSRSEAFRLYRVSPNSCDCRGWEVWRRCGHVALLRSELGLIDDVDVGDPEPEPIAAAMVNGTVMSIAPTVRCPDCNGRGFFLVPVPGCPSPASHPCRGCHATGRIKVNVVVGDRELRPVA